MASKVNAIPRRCKFCLVVFYSERRTALYCTPGHKARYNDAKKTNEPTPAEDYYNRQIIMDKTITEIELDELEKEGKHAILELLRHENSQPLESFREKIEKSHYYKRTSSNPLISALLKKDNSKLRGHLREKINN